MDFDKTIENDTCYELILITTLNFELKYLKIKNTLFGNLLRSWMPKVCTDMNVSFFTL